MVRRDRVRDRTDRGDRDVREFCSCFLSSFIYLSSSSSSFVVSDEMVFWFLSLSRLFLNATVRRRRRGKRSRERERRKNPRDHHLTLLSLITKQVRAELQRTRETPPQILTNRD